MIYEFEASKKCQVSLVVKFRRWYDDKLGIFHANQTSICLDTHQKKGVVGAVKYVLVLW